jgi:hypothetical protein
MQLEQDERSAEHGRDDEQPDDQWRRPALAVRLDQCVYEREQRDAGRQQAGEVEPLLVRGVPRLVDERAR